MSKNVHMEHIEELMFNEGVIGIRKAILFLKDLRNTFVGHTNNNTSITTKFDGAPAIFAGIDPRDKKFFVAKKGVFNKNPLVYKKKSDLKDLSAELKKKFSIALEEFSKLGIRSGIIQGDLMYTKGDIKIETIDGEKYYTMQPNTIVYSIPVKSKLGIQIARSRIGVVWHTKYTGRKLENMKASFGKNITSSLKNINSIWQVDATYKDESGATLSATDTEFLTKILSQAGKQFQRIDSNIINTIKDDEELKSQIKVYNNTHIRAGQGFPSPAKHVRGLFNYIDEWYDKKIDSLKSEKGKTKWKEQKQITINKVFSNFSGLVDIFILMNLLIEAKGIIVDHLNKTSSMSTFLRTKNGFKVTAPEGYVAIDQIGNAVKLVDRLEFSRANFSPDVIKGWETAGRK